MTKPRPWQFVGRRVAIAVGVLGLISRWLLAAVSVGCDDVGIWLQHAKVVAESGVRFAYENPHPVSWQFNHPPLTGYWAALAYQISAAEPLAFSFWIKLPGLLVELLSAALIYLIWSKRSPALASIAFAAYGWSLPLILISGYHGNTDCAYAGLTLLAAFLMQEKQKPFWAGMALGASLNIKLLPLIIIPPLLSQCRSRRAFFDCCAGLAVAGLPFVPFLVTSAPSMYKNMISYNSLQLEWGINAFLKTTAATAMLRPYVVSITATFIPYARYAILVIIGIFSATALYKRRPVTYEVCALAWAIFLVLTPGYGVQYAVCVLPLLFAVDIGRAVIYSLTAGIMLLLVYGTQLHLTYPLRANVQYFPYPPAGILFGVIAWVTLVEFTSIGLNQLWRSKRWKAPVSAPTAS
jgi:hypothetical protein